MRHLLIVSVVALTWGVACSNTTSADHALRLSDYSQSCSGDSDCVAVYAGILGCCGGSCANAAIAMASYAGYQHDLSVKVPKCVPPPPCAFLSATECGTPPPRCDNGVCTLPVDAGQI